MYFDWLIEHGQSVVFRESLLTWLVLIPIALVAGTVGGTVGFGSAVILKSRPRKFGQ